MSSNRVSVLMITYNHESFIAEALMGILNQKANFEVELVVCDDHSTDNTFDIVSELTSSLPVNFQFKVYSHKENIGMQANFLYAYALCTGDYIAYCEGDDYWTDSLKLQKQFDFLEKNLEYSLCFHQVSILENNKDLGFYTKNKEKNVFQTEDLIGEHFIATCSIFHRNNLNLPEWSIEIGSLDILILFLSSLNGGLYFIKDNMGVYRSHEGGVSKTHLGITKLYNIVEYFFYFKSISSRVTKDLIKNALSYEVETHILNPYKNLLNYQKQHEIVENLPTEKLLDELFIRFKIKFFNFKRR